MHYVYTLLDCASDFYLNCQIPQQIQIYNSHTAYIVMYIIMYISVYG